MFAYFIVPHATFTKSAKASVIVLRYDSDVYPSGYTLYAKSTTGEWLGVDGAGPYRWTLL